MNKRFAVPKPEKIKPALGDKKNFRNLSIGKKLTLGFGLVIVTVFIVIGAGYWGSSRAAKHMQTAVSGRSPAAGISAAAEANLLKVLSDIKEYLALGHPESRLRYARSRKAFEKNLAELEQLSGYFNDQNQADVRQVRAISMEWEQLPDHLFDLRDDRLRREPAYHLLFTEGVQTGSAMLMELGNLIESAGRHAASANTAEMVITTAKIQASFSAMLNGLRGYVTTRNLIYKGEYEANLKLNQLAWDNLLSLQLLMTPFQKDVLNRMITYRRNFSKLPARIFELLESDQWRKDLYLYRTEMLPRAEKMERLLRYLATEQRELLNTELRQAETTLKTALRLMLFGGVIAFLMGIGFSLVLREHIRNPLARLTRFAEQLGRGNLETSVPVESRDEIGILGETFNRMAKQLRGLMNDLERRGQELAALNESLEEKVQLRTQELRIANENLQAEIAVRIKTEADLRESEEYLAATLYSMGDGVITTDSAGRVIGMNFVAESLTGWKFSEAADKPLDSVFHIINSKTRARVENPIEKVLKHGIIVGLANHTALIAKDGTERQIADSGAPIRDKEGKIIGTVLVFRDVTEEYRLQDALRESEEKFHKAFHACPVIMSISTLDEGIFLDVNEEFLKLTGRSRDSVIGTKGTDLGLWPKNDRDAIIAEIRQHGYVHGKEVEIMTKSREHLCILWFADVVTINSRDCLIVSGYDLTRRKQAEAELFRANTLLAAVIRQAPFAAHVIEGDFNHIHVVIENAESRRIMGEPVEGREDIDAERSETLACRFFTIDGKREIPLAQMPSPRALQGETVTNEEFLFRHPDGTEIFVEANASPIYGTDGQIMAVVVTFHDVTDRKIAEAKLREYSEHLEEMVAERTIELKKIQEELLLKERLAVLGHFAGSISHEIRNPLAAIDSSAYFLNMKLGNSDEKIRQHLDRISANVQKAAAIIESLLSLTRMERPNAELCDLSEIIRESLGSSKIPKTVEITANFPEDTIFINTDSEQLRMALKNIIKNAVQAMNGTGTLTLSARLGESGQAELIISDTGPGISPEHLEKIFQPLFTTKAQGIGFGLSITKMIIENHGGTLRAESETGKGTSFSIILPQ